MSSLGSGNGDRLGSIAVGVGFGAVASLVTVRLAAPSIPLAVVVAWLVHSIENRWSGRIGLSTGLAATAIWLGERVAFRPRVIRVVARWLRHRGLVFVDREPTTAPRAASPSWHPTQTLVPAILPAPVPPRHGSGFWPENTANKLEPPPERTREPCNLR